MTDDSNTPVKVFISLWDAKGFEPYTTEEVAEFLDWWLERGGTLQDLLTFNTNLREIYER